MKKFLLTISFLVVAILGMLCLEAIDLRDDNNVSLLDLLRHKKVSSFTFKEIDGVNYAVTYFNPKLLYKCNAIGTNCSPILFNSPLYKKIRPQLPFYHKNFSKLAHKQPLIYMWEELDNEYYHVQFYKPNENEIVLSSKFDPKTHKETSISKAKALDIIKEGLRNKNHKMIFCIQIDHPLYSVNASDLDYLWVSTKGVLPDGAIDWHAASHKSREYKKAMKVFSVLKDI